MYRSGHVQRFLLSGIAVLVASFWPAAEIDRAWAVQPSLAQDINKTEAQGTKVTVRWGARPGVSRYRLQLARDSSFTDIVFDRVISGTAYEITDLSAGKYFWRVAALRSELGEFSSAGVVTVSEQPPLPRKDSAPGTTPAKTESFETDDGWRAAIGAVQYSVLAHLRTTSRSEIVALSASGVTYALDAASGIALWVAPPLKDRQTTSVLPAAPLLIKSSTRLDDVVVFAGSTARRFEGASGRELWRTTMPVSVSNAVVLTDADSAVMLGIDTSSRTLFLANAKDGIVISRTQLPARAVGPPLVFADHGKAAVALAYENGRVEIRDQAAQVIRSGNTFSSNITAPLFVKSSRGGLILVGTNSGLTALDAVDLHALGRVALPNDTPRGSLTAADLDGDGSAEVIMLTERGHVVAVHATDGKILWETDSVDDPQTVAFADVNRDGVVDVIVRGRQTLTSVLSGRDGSLLWKRGESRSNTGLILALPLDSATLLISNEASGLLAVQINRAKSK
jgi:outer membrane protein assembly factor BamB